MDSPIFCEINLEQPGYQQGFLRLPYSIDRSAYGWLPIPIFSIGDLDGPCVLLMGGNHGDEYEGQVSLTEQASLLKDQEICGQVIILPMANAPAAEAGKRVSPLDNGNLNRSFPGEAQGSPTQMIAWFIEHVLLKRADHLLDIHSGGGSMVYQPTLMMAIDDDKTQHTRNMSILQSLGFPVAMLYRESKGSSFSSSAARRHGAFPITAEMAGGGELNSKALDLLSRAIPRYLSHLGILKGYNPANQSNELQTQFYQCTDQACYVYAYHRGLFEPIAMVGDTVNQGQLVGRIHFPGEVGRHPVQVTANLDGRVLCRRVPAQVQTGDCLFEIGIELDTVY